MSSDFAGDIALASVGAEFALIEVCCGVEQQHLPIFRNGCASPTVHPSGACGGPVHENVGKFTAAFVHEGGNDQ